MRSCERFCGGLDVCEGFASVDGGFASAEQVEVWSVDDEDRHCYEDSMFV